MRKRNRTETAPRQHENNLILSEHLSQKFPQRDYRRDFPPKFYVSILVFVFLSLQFNFVKYVIVACELPNDNSLDQRMLLKN